MLRVLRVLTFGKWPAEGGRAPAPPAGRKVWRVSPGRPGGEWVDPHAAPPARDDGARSTLPMDSWTTSSMDLLDGVQVVEHDDDPAAGSDEPRPH